MGKIFIACSGVGIVQRGFETFALQLFRRLASETEQEVRLLKGRGGSSPGERTLPCLARGGAPARLLARICGRDGYFYEQTSFALALLPLLAASGPAVVLFSDCALGNSLWRLRQLCRLPCRLLFSNGGPYDPPFPRFDHIHQVSRAEYERARTHGETEDRMTFIPYGFDIHSAFELPDAAERTELRRRLNLPADRKLILSVGALNSDHKRMDRMIHEAAGLDRDRTFLLLLGERSPEAAELESLGGTVLGSQAFAVRTVPHSEIGAYYRAADAFALASAHEGFGRSVVEALAHGLPCALYPHDAGKSIVGSLGWLAADDQPGSLCAALTLALQEPPDSKQRSLRHAEMYRRYSWDALSSDYQSMFSKVLAL